MVETATLLRVRKGIRYMIEEADNDLKGLYQRFKHEDRDNHSDLFQEGYEPRRRLTLSLGIVLEVLDELIADRQCAPQLNVVKFKKKQSRCGNSGSGSN